MKPSRELVRCRRRVTNSHEEDQKEEELKKKKISLTKTPELTAGAEDGGLFPTEDAECWEVYTERALSSVVGKFGRPCVGSQKKNTAEKLGVSDEVSAAQRRRKRHRWCLELHQEENGKPKLPISGQGEYQ